MCTQKSKVNYSSNFINVFNLIIYHDPTKKNTLNANIHECISRKQISIRIGSEPILKSLQTYFHIIILRKRSNMRYYQRSILIGVLVLYLISSTLSLYASENKHHGRGYRDREREIGMLQYSQEQNNDDSMCEDFDNIKPERSSMSNEGFMIVSIIVGAILVIIIIILCICYCPNLFDLVCCCCDACELFSLCLPNTN